MRADLAGPPARCRSGLLHGFLGFLALFGRHRLPALALASVLAGAVVASGRTVRLTLAAVDSLAVDLPGLVGGSVGGATLEATLSGRPKADVVPIVGPAQAVR